MAQILNLEKLASLVLLVHPHHITYMIFKLCVRPFPLPGQVRAGRPHQGLHIRPQLLGPLSGLCNAVM